MAAMDGKLRYFMPRPNTAQFLPDFLAEAIQITQFTRANANPIQRRQQIKRGQFADGVGQGIDAHAQRLHFRGCFQHRAANATLMQHKRERQPPNTPARNQHMHRCHRYAGRVTAMRPTGLPLLSAISPSTASTSAAVAAASSTPNRPSNAAKTPILARDAPSASFTAIPKP